LAELLQPRAVNFLLSKWKERDWAVIAGASSFYIGRGEPNSEDVLIQAFRKFGDKTMAEKLLNCGNPKLEEVARAWAKAKGYAVLGASGRPVKWGGQG
jgi:hypothetical protein